MNSLMIFDKQQLIPLQQNDCGEVIISGRELHEFLEVKTPYKKWFDRMKEYGFVESIDFITVGQKSPIANGGYQEVTDHAVKLDMAKEIAMIQRNEKGKLARQYFLQVEKAWNSPEMIMKRALEIANKRVEDLKLENLQKQQLLEQQKPKVIFADAVSTSHTSILVGDLAKLIKQNGVDIGGKRLFSWLRENGYLIKRKGTDYNMPTQKSMELELFEVKETTINHSDGHITTNRTPKVTGKGQQYFINKFLS
ncbi:phage antirepressor KilAC domain-containing protein [Clostridium perfringens]|uniref:phage antirepressor KilAC domain-containing protein n=1 Tax=Clostridium perfringens TaxID=1502 RepID=UPI0013E32D55|nr:phage antirepressor KilAC domain-containing protein [Clostridium perfringens]EHK2355208.1 phage antirepressor KilAC domain-containing protein [Clostridium perfringens]MBO3312825.1 phage antirepressor KilAC domain-containing protein [Clostridium perfringens]MDK0687166.1 phage antirepressor KilAC domain-containing protein [Clostridium perfringens]MDM0478409.1 phage antirepressor KilAC domain-containing protein [Clostridium perfringens]MDM0486625.1 phage antirepressor KilAC domain-containing p